MLKKTSSKSCRWNVISANHKPYARKEVLKTITAEFNMCETLMENMPQNSENEILQKSLKN